MNTKELVENYRKGVLEYKKNNYSDALCFFKKIINSKTESIILSEVYKLEKEILIKSLKNSEYSLIENIVINDDIKTLEEYIYIISYYSLISNINKANFLCQKAIEIYNENYFKIIKNVLNRNQEISACIICKNNEDIIENCLKSLFWVDEIIVLDTGSIDNTIKIAKNYSKVYNYNWNDNFSDARNKALEYCTKDWILFIDTDQEFPKDFISKIRYAIKDTTKIGFQIKIKIDEYFVNYLRLFRNNFNIKYKGLIHEQVYHSIKENIQKYKYFTVGDLDIYLLDKGYANSKKMEEKKIRNIKLLEKAINIESNIYDKAYYLLKIYEETTNLSYLEEAFSIIKNFDKNDLLSYTFCEQIYKYYIINKDIELIDNALVVFNYSVDLHLIKAKKLFYEKNYIESKFLFDKVLLLVNNKKNYFNLINRNEIINECNYYIDNLILKIT